VSVCALMMAGIVASSTAAEPAAPPAEATGTGTTVSGTVTDSTGGALAGAMLTLRGSSSVLRTAVADGRGRYRFDRIAPGAYTLVAFRDHFNVAAVELKVGTEPVTADLTLTPASLTEEVTVSFTLDRNHTALKFDAPVRDIPLSVKSYSESFIKAVDVREVNELYNYMSGINTLELSGVSNPTLRGFGSSGAGSNMIQVNGMQGLSTRESTSITSIERIEVLKGPFAVLYGRTQPGGLVNLITKKPQAQQEYVFDLRTGTFLGAGLGFADRNDYRLGIDLTGPLVRSKRVLYRFIASYNNFHSFRDFVKREDLMVAPSLTWNISEGTLLTLEGEYRTVDKSMDWDLVAPRNDIKLVAPITTRYQEPEDWEKDHGGGATAYLTKRFASGLTWNLNLRALQQNDERLGFENESVTADLRVRRRDRHQLGGRSYYFLDTTLLRRVGRGSLQHSLLFGLGGGYETRLLDRDRFGNLGFLVDLYDPIYGNALRPADGRPSFKRREYLTDYDIYAQDRVDFGQHWKGLVALRFQQNENTWKESRLVPTGTFQSNTRNHIDPVVGLVFQPDARWSLYGSATTSFDPQFTVGVDAQGNSNFDPETGRQFETGVKAELAQGRVDATVALYHINKTGLLVPRGGGVFDQLGEARSRGLEFDLRVKPVSNWQMFFGYAYTDAKVVADRRPEFVGSRLLATPKHGFNVWSRLDTSSGFTRGLGLGVGLIWRGDRAGSPPAINPAPGTLPVLVLPGYFRADLGLYYVRGRSELTLRINNVLDKIYYDNSRDPTQIIPGSPREATLSWRCRL
jgi:iron complex outermembrane receptor protein